MREAHAPLSLEICKPTREQAMQVLRWRNDPGTLAMFFHRTPKTEAGFWEEYQRDYFRDPRVPPFFVLEEGERVAFLRFTPRADSGPGVYDVSINVDPARRGRRIGSRALERASSFLAALGAVELYAEIRAENAASIGAFARAGYLPCGESTKLIADTGERCSIVTYRNVLSTEVPRARALLVDLDGTLADSLGVMWMAFTRFLSAFQRPATREEFDSLNGPSLPEVVERLRRTHALPGDSASLVTSYLECVREAYAEVKPARGAAELLEGAERAGWVSAVVTANDSGIAKEWLRRVGLLSRVTLVIGGEDAARGKPAPDLFLAALACLKLPAETALALEDSPHGLKAARSACVRAVRVGASEGDEPGRSLEELAAGLQRKQSPWV